MDYELRDLLGLHHYQLLNDTIIPVGILDARERQYLPSVSAANLEKAMQRLANGDFTGAVGSACGAVDVMTTAIYKRDKLGDPGKEGFRAKVDKVLSTLNVFQDMETDLAAQGLQTTDAERTVEKYEDSYTACR